MAKGKILYLVTELDIGGAEKNLYRLAVGLAGRGWDVEVAALSGEGEVGEWLAREGIPVHHVHMDVKGDPIAFMRLVKLIRAVRPDILHTFLFHANVAGRLANVFAGVGVLCSSVRVAERRRRSHLWLDRLTQGLMDIEICVSQGVCDFTRERAGIRAEKLAVIPNPVEAPKAVRKRAEVRGEVGAGEGDFVVLSVGRLEPQKGYRYLVEAASIVVRRHPEAMFVVLGEGGGRGELEGAVAAGGLGGRFVLPGWRNEVDDFYGAADLFVLPSLWEGMPNALLEAMASGLGAVATDVEGSREVIRDGETGLLVPPKDPLRLAEALMRMISDTPLRLRVADAGRKHVLRAHNPGEFICEHETVYLDLLDGGRSGKVG